eukprot:scaffold613_cov243-Pinguiococcus_pyrenoidosus.AAC.47
MSPMFTPRLEATFNTFWAFACFWPWWRRFACSSSKDSPATFRFAPFRMDEASTSVTVVTGVTMLTRVARMDTDFSMTY